MKFYTDEKVTEHITRIRAFFDDACMYYIHGENRGLLVDTGYGFGHLKDHVDELADGQPYEVLLTHGHLDHANGAGEWEKVYLNQNDIALYHKHASIEDRKKFLKQYVPDIDSYSDDLFVPEHDDSFTDLKDGKVFDLGNVHVEAIEAPGHTKGMMVFLVKEDRTVLFGDACGVFTLFCMPESTSLEEYAGTLKKLKERMPEYDRILRQHGTCESPLSLVDEDIAIVNSILDGTDDHQPYEFNGVKCFVARKLDPYARGKRMDGKEGNIIYIPEKIRKEEYHENQ